MTDLPFQFPILSLVPDYGGWSEEGAETVEWSMTEDDFTDVSSFDFKKRPHTEMLIADSTGRCWHILSIKKVGVAGTGFIKLVNTITRDQHRVRYEVENVAAVPFEEIRRRACESIRIHPYAYRDDEAIAGESGPPRDEQEMLDELIGKVQAAKDMRSLIGVFQEWLVT